MMMMMIDWQSINNCWAQSTVYGGEKDPGTDGQTIITAAQNSPCVKLLDCHKIMLHGAEYNAE